jgi:uncharacterized membrane protein YsdA (DUF1294 family)
LENWDNSRYMTPAVSENEGTPSIFRTRGVMYFIYDTRNERRATHAALHRFHLLVLCSIINPLEMSIFIKNCMDFAWELFQTHWFIGTYLASINLTTIVVYGVDKIFARAHAWRVTERTLLLLALVGGSPGALLAIYLFHHKNRKSIFLLYFAIILLVQIGAGIGFFYLTNGLFLKNQSPLWVIDEL